ncbi:hypothetical protein C8J56DRAFT_931161 [Mycena floridula]|nr:hypothetical protein C8J56DRAFT_931161 [Mycena floridula]
MPLDSSLLALTPPSVDWNSLVDLAESSFLAIERWNDTNAKEPTVQGIIEQVHAQGLVYFGTIKLSVEVAQRSLDVSRDAIMIFESILADDSVTEIQDFIASTKKKANVAYKKTALVSKRFQQVRIGLDKITNQLPALRLQLAEKEQESLDQKAAATKRGERAKMFEKSAAVIGTVAGAVALSVFPPALLVMPVLVPLVVLASQVFSYKNKKAIKKRETEARDLRDAIQDLRQVSEILTNFRKQVDMFGDYWIKVEIALDEVARRIGELRKSKPNRIQLRAILAIWKELKDDYARYLLSLKRLQQLYRLSQKARENSKAEASKPTKAIEPAKPSVLKKQQPSKNSTPPQKPVSKEVKRPKADQSGVDGKEKAESSQKKEKSSWESTKKSEGAVKAREASKKTEAPKKPYSSKKPPVPKIKSDKAREKKSTPSKPEEKSIVTEPKNTSPGITKDKVEMSKKSVPAASSSATGKAGSDGPKKPAGAQKEDKPKDNDKATDKNTEKRVHFTPSTSSR